MSGIEYYFNNIDANTFQRLVNSILLFRFGEIIRLTPKFGSDGGRDGETAVSNPIYEFQIENNQSPSQRIGTPPQKGRYFFQVKHHRTIDTRLSDARSAVISDFDKELKKNVLDRHGNDRVNFFFLVTNVPSSEKSIAEIDKRQKEIRKSRPYLYADVWWSETVEAYLDQMPQLWHTYPSLFAGGKVPFLAEISYQGNKGLPRATRLAIERQYQRDSIIKFRQIDLEKQLHKLFTGLDIGIQHLNGDDQTKLMISIGKNLAQNLVPQDFVTVSAMTHDEFVTGEHLQNAVEEVMLFRTFGGNDALRILLGENTDITRKIILEGGPGQGKSTLTQMLIQIYRQQLLNKNNIDPEERWFSPIKSRLPLRIELRLFAEWLNKTNEGSIEEYFAYIFSRDSGGSTVTVDDIHNMVEASPIMLVFDGLDEVGNDGLRNEVLAKIAECISRFENDLAADLRVIITTRPPTVTNCKEYLTDFKRFPIIPLSSKRIKEYVQRWLNVQLQDEDDRKEIGDSFEKRQNEPHVQAIIKNPMQLSVLLHFIRLKGAAFPDRRAELYREYFRTVIDRDVEKSSNLREQREIIESLHQFLGYKIHGLTEDNQADGTLSRNQLLHFVENWLKSRGNISKPASELFKLGEERLGLIVALRGEGEETRYGYEIQPIREYFAAAFINDDIEGNAHEVFQNMIRRTYWREVSLFLAGLRRPNEKADLIARAKNLDNDEKLGWRQDGRNLTLQLLQEGVFSQPPHVFADALDYQFDLLDPKLARFQNEPKGLSRILPDLFLQDSSTKKRYNDRILKLIQEYNNSNDEYVLFRLYHVACKLLDSDKMMDLILSHQGNNFNLLTKLRLQWPLQWNINIYDAMQTQPFWAGIPDSVWSIRLWQFISNLPQPKNMFIPSRFHQLLAEQFAVRGVPVSTSFLHLEDFSNPLLTIAQLINYLKIFHSLEEPTSLHIRKKIALYLNENVETNSEGLYPDFQIMMADILNTFRTFLRTIFLDKGNPNSSLGDHLSIIHKYILQPGLIGWFASKWAIHIINSPVTINNLEANNQNLLNLIYNDLNILFADNTYLLGEKTPLLYSRQIPFYPNPQNILLNLGEMVKVTELITKKIQEEKEFPFNWVDQITLTSSMMRSLIDDSKSAKTLEDLLSFIASKPILLLFNDQNLHTSHIQRILKTVRATNNPKILKGASIALASSKFLRLAGSKQSLRLLQADTDASVFARNIFIRRGKDETNKEEKEIINEVAREVMASPNNYSFRVNTMAADYLAESTQISLLPLLTLEEELKIRISSNKTGE